MNVLIDKNYITAIADNSFVPAYGESTTRSPETPDQIVTQIGNISTQNGFHELAKIINGATNKALKLKIFRTNKEDSNCFGPGCEAKHVIIGTGNGSTPPAALLQSYPGRDKHLSAFYDKNANLRAWKDAGSVPFLSTDTITDIYTDALTTPSNWGRYATKKGRTSLTVHYGVTEDEYLELVAAYTAPAANS